jgi:NADPH-dependent 2,4-dienoyl-CoA reductase/sulfur reductase-like enzyme
MQEINRILVVGASLAGLRIAEQLRAEGFDGELTVLGEEKHQPYDRPPLSKSLLAGRTDPAMIELRRTPGLEVDWVLGERATALDLGRREVTTASGRAIAFDGLAIATGSRPRRLPGLDPTREGVFELRTLDDALALRKALTGGSRLAIVGAGFIGVEVASTARGLGLEVEIVSLDPPLAPAGKLISKVVADQIRDHGVGLHLGRVVERIEGVGAVEALVLDDGSRLEADAVLVAVGAAPCVDWLAGSGVPIADGVVCDSCCAAIGVDGVVAAGDVASWEHPGYGGGLRVEHWTNAVEQALAAARTLLHGPARDLAYTPIPSFWSDHFGTRVQSIGIPGRADRFELVEGEVAERRFAAVALRDDEMVGAVAYGMPKALAPLRARLAERLVGVVA